MKFRVVLTSCLLALGVLWSPFAVEAEWEIPAPTGYVWDQAEVLDNTPAIEKVLSDLADSSEYEMAVVILDKLPREETIETAAVKIFNTWGIGDAEKDTGLLLLISIGDRETRLEVGYGVEGILPDIMAHRFTESMSPYFQEGDFSAGVEHGVTGLIAYLTDEEVRLQSLEEVASSTETAQNEAAFWMFIDALMIGGLSILAGLAAFLGKTKSIWLGGVIGAVFGAIVMLFLGIGFWAIIVGGILGLIFDFIISNGGGGLGGGSGGSWGSGSSSGSSGGSSSFGGFSGGSSGGGGSTSKW